MTDFLSVPTISEPEYPAFHGNINKLTEQNNTYRTVLATTATSQLVVMSLLPKQDIGNEIHPYITQFIRVEKGSGVANISGIYYDLSTDMAIIVPPNTYHNIINTSTIEPLKLYTVYSPPQHPQDLVQLTKSD